ncbi:MAG: thioredoxin [Clostridia bacterium]|nr:thioredoxin [Clostridia bacterium]
MEIVLTVENFENEVLKSDKPVLVDFWATWCGPCRMIAPIIEEIAHDYEGKIKVGKVNVDEQEELAVRYGISSIPTLLLFKNGEVAKKTLGYMPKDAVVKFIEE